MNIVSGINPNNANQARIFFGYPSASFAGERRHAQVVMRELAAELGFRVIGGAPASLDLAPALPGFIFDVPWTPVRAPEYKIERIIERPA